MATALLSTTYAGRYAMNLEHDMTPEEILELGDTTLASNEPLEAIKIYEQGISSIDEKSESLLTSLSLYTNLGTAYSSTGNERKAVEMYRDAILLFSNHIEDVVDESTKKAATDITAQAAFFLGMTHEELENYRKAADSYAFAASLDPYHWAGKWLRLVVVRGSYLATIEQYCQTKLIQSNQTIYCLVALANMGAVLQDHLKEPAEALLVYNQAYDILTQTQVEPTDPPSEPKLVLSQLQYRIGLAITYSEKQKCVLKDDPTKEVPCSEMAASAFNYAIQLDPSNENAKHMLAAVTADATMRRASNDYVTQLFEDYAEK
jgi:tetratricopeptide (TPR) repeat protein